jgi:hypothetical protein
LGIIGGLLVFYYRKRKLEQAATSNEPQEQQQLAKRAAQLDEAGLTVTEVGQALSRQQTSSTTAIVDSLPTLPTRSIRPERTEQSVSLE